MVCIERSEAVRALTSKAARLEEEAIRILKEKGDEGIYQSELWKLLKVDSREGSRLALRLVKMGIARREPVVANGKRTYKLVIAESARRPQLSVKVDGLMDIPCFSCSYLHKCSSGNFYNPETCLLLTRWLLMKADELSLTTKGDGS